MKQAELITNKSGRCLVCWYFGTQYNEAIAEAERLHGVEGDASVTVICLPERSKLQSSQVWKRRPIRQSRS